MISRAYQQVDSVSGKVITHYGEHSIFTMYTKKYNGKMHLAFLGTGENIKEVLEYYNGYALYPHDRKYLFHRLVHEPKEAEKKLLMDSGETSIAKMPPELHNGDRHKRVTYEFANISSLEHIPITIINGLNDFIKKKHVINSQVMNKTRLISILMADFLSMPENEQLDFLARADLLLEKHKLDSGGVSRERLIKAIKSDQASIKDGDLL